MRVILPLRPTAATELDDEEDRHEILAAGVGEGADTLNKGQKRRLLDAVNQVIESAEGHQDHLGSSERWRFLHGAACSRWWQLHVVCGMLMSR